MLLGSGAAEARSTLEAIGSESLTEVSHRLDVRFGTRIAEVEETLVIANKTKSSDAEAKYTFELPAQAAITNLSVVTSTGKKSSFAVVGAEAATRLVADPANGHEPDMGLVRMIRSEGSDDSDRNEYELRVFPIPADRTTTIHLTWSGTVRLVAGNYSIRIPGRGDDARLSRTEVVVAPSSSMSQLYGGETLLAARSRPLQKHRFFAPATGDLTIQGKGQERSASPRAEVALMPLSPTSGVAAIRVLLPDGAKRPAPTIDRALLIVDTSSSMSKEGTDAAARVADKLLTDLGESTRVETILYERHAREILGGFQPATREARSKILGSIRSAAGGNGSNLADALGRAFALLASESNADMSRTLIAIISDGMIPTALAGEAAADILGEATLAQASLLSVVLVPPNAPLPDVHSSALGAMMRRGKGRIVALRHADASLAGASLLTELGQPAPLETLEVELSSGDFVGADLAGQLRPGSSIAALGFYQGKAPARVTIRGLRAGKPETLVASKVSGPEAKLLAAIAVANARPFGMPGVDRSAEQSRSDMRDAAAKTGAVTMVSAGIAVPAGDAYALDRVRSAGRWGMQTYRRLPPPIERTEAGKHFEPFEFRQRVQGPNRGRTGVIDEEMIARRVRAHVIPHARRCYERLLLRDRNANGALTLHIEMARGEVLHAAIPVLPPSLEPIRSCIEDAMYAMPVPVVRQGQAAELVSVAKYPLRFRRAKEKGDAGAVETGGDAGEPDDTLNPLTGLPE